MVAGGMPASVLGAGADAGTGVGAGAAGSDWFALLSRPPLR